MHPAGSVILFTSLTGFGYGLLIWSGIGILSNSDLLTERRVVHFFLICLTKAALLVTLGLTLSLLHLGHPERAWRAMSQWRTSWLSREGLCALITYIPLVLIIPLLFFGLTLPVLILAPLLIISSAATVYTTAMIYASLKPIPAWSNHWTIALYPTFALMSGGMLWVWLLHIVGVMSWINGNIYNHLVTLSALGALVVKVGWLHHLAQPTQTTAQSAIGLPGRYAPSIRRIHRRIT